MDKTLFVSEHVASVNKRSDKETQISKLNIGDRKFVDIRDCFTKDKKTWIAMRKGITIPLACLSDVITILERIEAEASKEITDGNNKV